MELYTVRAGDTFPALARRFGIGPEELARANQLPGRRVVPGMSLLIPSNSCGEGRDALVFAYACPDAADEVLRETLPSLSALLPFSFRLTETGELLPPERTALRETALEGGAAPFLTVSNLTASGGFSGRVAHAVLTDPAVQEPTLNRLLAVLESGGWAGVCFHLQYVFPFDREAYSRFLRRASALLHERGLLVCSALAPQESAGQEGLLCGAQDMAAHGEAADFVILLSFEWGHVYSAPQAVSPLPRVRRAVAQAASLIPPGKLLMGFTNHGYRWRLPWRQGDTGELIGSAAAQELAAAMGAQLRYDEHAAAPFFTYTDTAGQRSVVWYEDARSTLARLRVAEEYALGGVCLWTADRLFRPALLLMQDCFQVTKFV